MLGMPSQQCNIADPASPSPLHRAAARSEEEVVRTLQSMRTRLTPAHFTKAVNLKASDSDRTGGYSALHYACQNGLPGAVRALLENGADPNVRKNNGMPPLMSAIHGAGRQSLNKGNASIAGNERCVELLCTHLSFDLNSNDDDSAQISPVWCCVAHEYDSTDMLLPLLKLLLARGFSPNGTIHEFPALHMALYNNHIMCAEALVRAGASFRATAPRRFSDGPPWTAREICQEFHGGLADRLERLASVSAAVADSQRRQARMRGSDAATEKQAKKADKAGWALLSPPPPPSAAAAAAYECSLQGPVPLQDLVSLAMIKNATFFVSIVSLQHWACLLPVAKVTRWRHTQKPCRTQKHSGGIVQRLRLSML